jgi:xylulokinase
MNPAVIRAGKANMFLSDVFTGAFVNATDVPVELYECDGSVGAAIGAGIGAGIYSGAGEAFAHAERLKLVEPSDSKLYYELYGYWKELLEKQLEN